MKQVLLVIAWFPATISLITFSLFQLYTYKNNHQLLAVTQNVEAKDISFPLISPVPIIKGLETDIRISALQRFLSERRSPLAKHVHDLVAVADEVGIDYALLPAIAIQESGGCKKIPSNSFNCWGFGIYGDKVIRFNSYKQAFYKVAKTIKETYIKKGLTNPTLLEDRWAPPSRGQWSYAVTLFMSKIHEYEKISSTS